ncbi:MAG: putative toxin-antitoxin system toxin component, PIN family [Thermodesulfobacteriota bacterium]|nr:putative toxin-antitoxin system toxin component, PIN family [Thermodesulfobacteriota bacterium]
MGKIKVKRVVIDTNVIVSGLLFGGAPGELVVLWKTGSIQPLISEEIIDEYMKVLAYPKFKLTEEEIDFLIYHEILPYFDVTTVNDGQVIIKDDPSDDKFIRCAEEGRADIIVSGDKHLLNLKSYGTLRILTLSQFLAELRDNQETNP